MAELQRIALRKHANPVSRIISIAVRLLRTQSPGLRLLISYADPMQDHHGGVYQASGWIYTGRSADDWKLVMQNGKSFHSRVAGTHVHFGVKKTIDVSRGTRVTLPGKHRYLMPLDPEMRARILPLAKPYPKRTKEQAPGHPSGLGGVTPTRALQTCPD